MASRAGDMSDSGNIFRASGDIDNGQWNTVGRDGRVVRQNSQEINDSWQGGQGTARGNASYAQVSSFKDVYNRGLRRSWFETMKDMERACLHEAYTFAAICPNSALVQIPIGWNGSPAFVMESIIVSLARITIKLDGGEERKMDAGLGGDFRITPTECSTLYSIQFKDEKIKQAVLSVEKIPWFKKARNDPGYSVKGELKIRDLTRPQITMEIQHYKSEINDKYDAAITELYTRKCGHGVEIKIEEGTKEQKIDLGGGNFDTVLVYTGKKYVHIKFPVGTETKGLLDGKLQLDLGIVYGKRNVFVRQVGKKYACQTCGGWECERYYCINRCIYCRRELISGDHIQSLCQDRGIVTHQHIQKTKDLERAAREMYMPAVRVSGTNEELQADLNEREGIAWQKIEHKIKATTEFNMKEAKGKAFGDTPYTPSPVPGPSNVKGLKRKGGKINERLLQVVNKASGTQNEDSREPVSKMPNMELSTFSSSDTSQTASNSGVSLGSSDTSEAASNGEGLVDGKSREATEQGRDESEDTLFSQVTQPDPPGTSEKMDLGEGKWENDGNMNINIEANSEHSLQMNIPQTPSDAMASPDTGIAPPPDGPGEGVTASTNSSA